MKNKRQKFVTNLTLLPIELLEKIFQYVLKDGDLMFLHLSLVCKCFHNIVQQESFRRAVHFAWLRSVFDWTKASQDFLKENFVMYSIKECSQCGKNYKEMFGFIGQGKFGQFHKYYSDLDVSHMNYCSIECMHT